MGEENTRKSAWLEHRGWTECGLKPGQEAGRGQTTRSLWSQLASPRRFWVLTVYLGGWGVGKWDRETRKAIKVCYWTDHHWESLDLHALKISETQYMERPPRTPGSWALYQPDSYAPNGINSPALPACHVQSYHTHGQEKKPRSRKL